MSLPSTYSTKSAATTAASIILICTIICLLMANLISTEEAKAETEDLEELGLHYGKYLKDVVAALDKDQKFTETIKNMNADDIKSGKVAEQLKHVHEKVRDELNDLKYLEIQRLRDLAARDNEIKQYGETYHGTKRKWRTLGHSLSELPDHLGSKDGNFDVNDLHKLMVAATNDLEKLDKERKEDFKTYEMEKEYQFQEGLKLMNETEKAKAIKLRKELKEKHDNHAKVPEPGKMSHFKDVWENDDRLPANEFDPKTFFALHDTNSDNYWDPSEVRKLLNIEIQKLYDTKNPEDDPNEMNEEYERMREHIYKEIDLDRDGLISIHEFLEYSKKPQFQKDNGWEDPTKDAYTKQDYEDFQKRREEMLKNRHGYYDPAFYANQPSNLHLPDWGLGMPAGVQPHQYYQYHVDPNHPQAQQMLAAQQQQHMAYQAAAYHQAAVAASGYQQPQQYHPQAPMGQQPPIAQPQAYQAPPQMQSNQPPAQPQLAYDPQAQVVNQQQPNIPQVAPLQQQQPAQATYQQAPPPPQQQIPQQQYVQQQVPQQQVPQQQVPQQQVPQQQVPQQQVPQQIPQQQVPQQQVQQQQQQMPQQQQQQMQQQQMQQQQMPQQQQQQAPPR